MHHKHLFYGATPRNADGALAVSWEGRPDGYDQNDDSPCIVKFRLIVWGAIRVTLRGNSKVHEFQGLTSGLPQVRVCFPIFDLPDHVSYF